MPTHRPRQRWSRRRWVTLIGIALLVVALVAGWFALVSPRPLPAPATETVKVTRTSETTSVSLSGVIRPQQQANVSFAVPGTVRAIDTKVGETVTAGQTLATLDDRDLRNAATLAEANLKAARAQLQTVRDASSSTSAQVTAVQAQVSSAQASLDQARTRLGDAVLTAPIAGIVATVDVEVGDQVAGGGGGGLGSSLGGGGMSGAPGGSLSGMGGGLSGLGSPDLSSLGGGSGSSSGSGAQFVIIVPDAWKLEATVGTADVAALKAGQPAVVTPKGTETHVSGTVDSVGIVASGASGQAATFPVTIRVNDKTSALFAGSSADAVVTTETVEGVLTVPGNAIEYDGTQAHVRVPDGAEGRLVPVTTGRQFGDRVEIVSGLQVGDELLAPKAVTVSGPPPNPFDPRGTSSPSPSPSR
ncbi:HlyD family efflux transporter periplasmic adaptor subunit [Propioniciclava coleopterorum]|uniref:HlyD family efflux transporter periplasmic adaptor subunit n=1 Tax=Propioniciclava coleopterorum TaxID=2714937 RepID=A0A6G7Y889_9ACTN|nr:HlyD family efflux transporter periplasmic adaptor subunit [Propioniciclava coleopterorum]QIK72868.1 HlyD family efflux transporter periplasmic adaptor subunit [Propioniciclava coleopterorum]